MKMRARVTLLFVALVVALPGSASAAAEQIAPNFDDAYGYTDCGRVVYPLPPAPGACTASHDARIDGTLDIDLAAGTPLEGRVPGPSWASGSGELFLNRALPDVIARVFVYTVTVHVTRAAATGDQRPLSSAGSGSISLNANVNLDEGERYDFDYAYHDLVDLQGEWAPSSVSDEDITFTLVVGDGQSRVHVGRVSLFISAYANANAGTSVASPASVPRGSVKVSLDAAVTSVTVDAIV